jgi:hypothetical protein
MAHESLLFGIFSKLAGRKQPQRYECMSPMNEMIHRIKESYVRLQDRIGEGITETDPDTAMKFTYTCGALCISFTQPELRSTSIAIGFLGYSDMSRGEISAGFVRIKCRGIYLVLHNHTVRRNDLEFYIRIAFRIATLAERAPREIGDTMVVDYGESSRATLTVQPEVPALRIVTNTFNCTITSKRDPEHHKYHEPVIITAAEEVKLEINHSIAHPLDTQWGKLRCPEL